MLPVIRTLKENSRFFGVPILARQTLHSIKTSLLLRLADDQHGKFSSSAFPPAAIFIRYFLQNFLPAQRWPVNLNVLVDT